MEENLSPPQDPIARFARRAQETLDKNRDGGRPEKKDEVTVLQDLDPNLRKALEEVARSIPGGSGGTTSQDSLKNAQGNIRYGR